MRHTGSMVVAMAFMLMAILVQAEPEAWREHVVAAVRPGAVVARRGLDNDPITQAVLLGQGGGRWSHVGIAVQLIPDGQIYIESAMPGAGTKLEKPEVFFSAEQASEGEVLLMPVDKVDAVQSAAKSLLGRPFDDQLAFDDDGKKTLLHRACGHCIAKRWGTQRFANAIHSIFASKSHCTDRKSVV